MKYLGPPSSGSQGGTTASRNRAGQYFRSRRAPVQPVGTGRRAFVRSAFGSASAAWASLNSEVQAAWNAYAASRPVTDALGQAITLTGHQMYVGIGTALLNAGQDLPTSIPVDNSTSSPVITAFTVTAPGTITLTLDASGSLDDFILVSFSAPQSGGVTFCKTFWQNSVEAGNAGSITGLGADYVAQFGSLTAGQKVFLKLTPVNQYGVTGVPVIQSVTVG